MEDNSYDIPVLFGLPIIARVLWTVCACFIDRAREIAERPPKNDTMWYIFGRLFPPKALELFAVLSTSSVPPYFRCWASS